MNYKQIESHFESEEKLQQLLEKYQECFDSIDYYENLFRQGIIATAHETDDAMKKLSGIYISLNLVTTIAETEKKNREHKYFEIRKIAIEKEGQKPISAQLEKEASVHVATYRRIRNIFQAYRNSCDRVISVCQSSLKSLEREKTVPQE